VTSEISRAIIYALGMNKYAVAQIQAKTKVKKFKVRKTFVADAPPIQPVVAKSVVGVPGSTLTPNKSPQAVVNESLKFSAKATLPKNTFTNTVAAVKSTAVPKAPIVNPAANPLLRPPRLTPAYA
jgi:hypothetical protein